MSKQKIQLLSSFLMLTLLFSMSPTIESSISEDETTNFELLMLTSAGSRVRESMAFYIQKALLPLGIDVRIQAKPFGQFVGDLLHVSQGQPFDLALVNFEESTGIPQFSSNINARELHQPGIQPSFSWQYLTNSSSPSYADDLYQLRDKDWQSYQYQDTGVHSSEVDQLLLDIDTTQENTIKRDLIYEFTELFYDKLLYDLPLISLTPSVSSWLGYGDDNNPLTTVSDPMGQIHENNDLWMLEEGAVGSRALGAVWNPDTMIDTRYSAVLNENINFPGKRIYLPNETLYLRTLTPGAAGMFDPYQAKDKETSVQSELLTSTLLQFDSNNIVRPGIAYNFIMEDWDVQGDGSNIVNNGKWTFFINADGKDLDSVGDWVFPATRDYLGNFVPAETVDANDFALVLQMMKFAQKVPMNLNGINQFNRVQDWNVSSTINTDDTLTIYLNSSTSSDLELFGGISPLPEHILNQTMKTSDGTNFTPFIDEINPQLSLQWSHWSSEEGITLAGPYSLDFFDKGQYFGFEARDDFPFPNEWDTEFMYSQYSLYFQNFTFESSTSLNHGDLSTFAPTINTASPALYWNGIFGGDSDNKIKPNHQGINFVVYKVVDDDNAAKILFEAGGLDFLDLSHYSMSTSNTLRQNNNYVVKSMYPMQGPEMLVFNLLNDHLQKRDVRYAIASVIDRNDLVDLVGGQAITQESPVWAYHKIYMPSEFIGAGPQGVDLSYYTDQFSIPYDYKAGRDLMWENGYSALEEGFDSTPPQLLNDPQDITFGNLDINNVVIWQFTSEIPDTYQVEINSQVLFNDPWDGEPIGLNYDNLTAGVYDTTVTVKDQLGRTLSDSVKVTVVNGSIATSATSTNPIEKTDKQNLDWSPWIQILLPVTMTFMASALRRRNKRNS